VKKIDYKKNPRDWKSARVSGKSGLVMEILNLNKLNFKHEFFHILSK
jgi:hypothetical protein